MSSNFHDVMRVCSTPEDGTALLSFDVEEITLSCSKEKRRSNYVNFRNIEVMNNKRLLYKKIIQCKIVYKVNLHLLVASKIVLSLAKISELPIHSLSYQDRNFQRQGKDHHLAQEIVG